MTGGQLVASRGGAGKWSLSPPLLASAGGVKPCTAIHTFSPLQNPNVHCDYLGSSHGLCCACTTQSLFTLRSSSLCTHFRRLLASFNHHSLSRFHLLHSVTAPNIHPATSLITLYAPLLPVTLSRFLPKISFIMLLFATLYRTYPFLQFYEINS